MTANKRKRMVHLRLDGKAIAHVIPERDECLRHIDMREAAYTITAHYEKLGRVTNVSYSGGEDNTTEA